MAVHYPDGLFVHREHVVHGPPRGKSLPLPPYAVYRVPRATCFLRASRCRARPAGWFIRVGCVCVCVWLQALVLERLDNAESTLTCVIVSPPPRLMHALRAPHAMQRVRHVTRRRTVRRTPQATRSDVRTHATSHTPHVTNGMRHAFAIILLPVQEPLGDGIGAGPPLPAYRDSAPRGLGPVEAPRGACGTPPPTLAWRVRVFTTTRSARRAANHVPAVCAPVAQHDCTRARARVVLGWEANFRHPARASLSLSGSYRTLGQPGWLLSSAARWRMLSCGAGRGEEAGKRRQVLPAAAGRDREAGRPPVRQTLCLCLQCSLCVCGLAHARSSLAHHAVPAHPHTRTSAH